MDLSEIKSGTIERNLYIPGIGETGFILKLRYESAPEVQAVNKKFEGRLLEEAKKGKRGDSGAAREWFKRERMVAHIAGWRWDGDVTYNKEQPKFSEEKAREMIEGKDDFSYFLRDFIEEQIGDASEFLGKSAKG